MLYISQKNWLLQEITEKEFKEINVNFFRSTNPEKTIQFVNEDSKNIIPYIKDILNRKHRFIEIRLLKVIIIIIIFMLIIQVYQTYKIRQIYKKPTASYVVPETQEKNKIIPNKPL